MRLAVPLGLLWLVFSDWEILRDADALAVELRKAGWQGPLLCVGIQFLQVIVFFIPGEITQIAAGYVFGPWLGFLYSVIGIMAGSACAYLLARRFGRTLVRRLFGDNRVKRLQAAVASDRGLWAIFLLFLTPGLPKDALSYAAGLSELGLGRFIFISALGRGPAMFVSAMIGAQVYERDWSAVAVTGGLALVTGSLFWLYMRQRRTA